MRLTTWLYDDPDHPDRVTGTIESPAWTDEDRALLLGLQLYEGSLCQCGEPRSLAWHSELEGWYETDRFVCHACTARNGGEQVVYVTVRNTYPFEKKKGPLPVFKLGETTSTPDNS